MTPSKENPKKTIGVIILSFLVIPAILMIWSFVRLNMQEKRLENELTNIFINHETELNEWASLLPEAITGDDNDLRSQILYQELPAICDWINSELNATEEFSLTEYDMDCAVIFEQNEGEFLLTQEPTAKGLLSDPIEDKEQIEFINDLEFGEKQMPVLISKEDTDYRRYNVHVEISAEPWIIMNFSVRSEDR